MRYRVLLQGKNLLIRESDAVQRIGFVATRYVDATTPAEARKKAAGLVLSELMSFVEEPISEVEGKVKCLETEHVSWMRARLLGAKGFTFYRAEEGLADRDELSPNS
jgi:hypothetical protein